MLKCKHANPWYCNRVYFHACMVHVHDLQAVMSNPCLDLVLAVAVTAAMLSRSYKHSSITVLYSNIIVRYRRGQLSEIVTCNNNNLTITISSFEPGFYA